jgi:CRP/FNR family transcriptional regulator
MFVSVQEITAEAAPAPAGARQAKAQPARPHCSRCLLREWCLPSGGLASGSADCRDNLMFGRRRIRTGDSLYQEGEPFQFLYEVRSGNLKSSLTTSRGQARVSGFPMAGELMGLDGVANGRHASSATALEDTEVCAVSYAFLTELAASNTGLQRTLMRQLSREIVRELRLLVLLGSMSADRRLATFLLNLSQRLAARGYSPFDFRMRMSRADIGSYLGLTLETVSRNFSSFQRQGLLEVDQRHIRITDLAGLTRIGDLHTPKAPRSTLGRPLST